MSSIYSLSEDQQDIFDAYKTGENIFITGPGGCGKSHLIKCIIDDIKKTEKKYSVTATTGCAAILLGLGAKTINSWAGIGIANQTDNIIVTSIMMDNRKKKNWKNTDILIIDEVSMMSKHMFELLDSIGKRVRNNASPFGGIQLILSGDFYQLPPVGDKERNPDSCKFCFESNLWADTFDSQFILDKSFRQKDEDYISILNQIREGRLSRGSYNLLKSRVGIKPDSRLITKPVSLCATRKLVEQINKVHIDNIDDETFIYDFKGKYSFKFGSPETSSKDGQTSITSFFQSNKPDVSGNVTKDEYNLHQLYDYVKEHESTRKFKEVNSTRSRYSQLPSSKVIERSVNYLDKNSYFTKSLCLKIGSQVMCTKNLNIEKGIYNGAVGIVKKFNPENVEVLFNNGTTYNVDYQEWEHDATPDITYYQIPLVLAWAITIHKSQGASLDYAELDIGDSVFAEGQTYVALSRVRSLQGLFIKSFNPGKIRTNPKVVEFYKQFLYETDDESVAMEDA